MSAELPEWQPLALGAGTWIDAAAGEGRVVAVLAPKRGSGGSWSERLAFELAAGWAESGHRVVVADAAVEEPSLHELAELENGEGLVDAALYGSSVAHVARSVPGQAFFLVTAGSPIAYPPSVAECGRWTRLVAGFRQAGVTLLLFLREEGAGLDAFLGCADDVVLLAERPEAVRVPGDVSRVRAVLGPRGGDTAPAGVEEDAAARVADPGPGRPTASTVEAPHDGLARADASLAGPGPIAPPDEPPLSEGPFPEGPALDAQPPAAGAPVGGGPTREASVAVAREAAPRAAARPPLARTRGDARGPSRVRFWTLLTVLALAVLYVLLF